MLSQMSTLYIKKAFPDPLSDPPIALLQHIHISVNSFTFFNILVKYLQTIQPKTYT